MKSTNLPDDYGPDPLPDLTVGQTAIALGYDKPTIVTVELGDGGQSHEVAIAPIGLLLQAGLAVITHHDHGDELDFAPSDERPDVPQPYLH